MTSKKRLILSYGILALLLAVLFAANLFWGSVSLTPGAVLAALTGRGQDALSVGIITQLRLPRAVMVVLLGAALSAAGSSALPQAASSDISIRAPSSMARNFFIFSSSVLVIVVKRFT